MHVYSHACGPRTWRSEDNLCASPLLLPETKSLCCSLFSVLTDWWACRVFQNVSHLGVRGFLSIALWYPALNGFWGFKLGYSFLHNKHSPLLDLRFCLAFNLQETKRNGFYADHIAVNNHKSWVSTLVLKLCNCYIGCEKCVQQI